MCQMEENVNKEIQWSGDAKWRPQISPALDGFSEIYGQDHITIIRTMQDTSAG